MLGLGIAPPAVEGAAPLEVEMNDAVRARYLGDQDHAVYLVRPDQVVAARWVDCNCETVQEAVRGIWTDGPARDIDLTGGTAGHFDEAYDEILAAFAEVGEENMIELAASLVVTLSNRIGDLGAIKEAVDASRFFSADYN